MDLRAVALALAIAAPLAVGSGCLLDKTGYIEDPGDDAGAPDAGGGGQGGAPPAVPTCSDGVRNGGETDVDCGGECQACGFGHACKVDGDCRARCEGGLCVAEPFGVWRVEAPAVAPPARAFASMSFDAKRGRAVLFGGLSSASTALGDTGERNGTSWRAAPAGPPARWVPATTYDAARGVTVMFGGYPPDPTTWEYDGAAWTAKLPAGSPQARWSAAVAYDADRERVVLFGGHNGAAALDETWEYDGTGWLQRTPVSHPSARVAARMAYDAARKRMILFGGELSASPQLVLRYADTWAWDGATWTELSPEASPPPRSYASMTYDPERERVVMYGGANGDGLLGDTWAWDGARWSAEGAGPLSLMADPMVFDTARHRALLYAGFSGTAFIGQTWERVTLATACSKHSDCGSGVCQDGLCCASACGICSACDTPASPGECAPVVARDDPDTCGGPSTCDAEGTCVPK